MWQILHASFRKFSKLSNNGISLNWSINDEVTTRYISAYFFGPLCILRSTSIVHLSHGPRVRSNDDCNTTLNYRHWSPCRCVDWCFNAELDVGLVHPWVELRWVVIPLMRFFWCKLVARTSTFSLSHYLSLPVNIIIISPAPVVKWYS